MDAKIKQNRVMDSLTPVSPDKEAPKTKSSFIGLVHFVCKSVNFQVQSVTGLVYVPQVFGHQRPPFVVNTVDTNVLKSLAAL